MTVEKAKRMENGLLRAGELAGEAGVPVSTVRYYAEAGLISSVKETAGGQRLFPRSEVETVRGLKSLTRERWSLAQIQGVLAG